MNGDQPITHWHFVIDGFTRHEGQASGSNYRWRELNHLSSDTCCVEYKTWRQNWEDIAELVNLFRPRGVDPVVKIYPYSWGGWSSVLLANALDHRDIPVHTIVFADGVYRYHCALGQWRAMLPHTIVVPKNVREVWSFRQTHPRFSLHRDNGEWTGWKNFAQPAGHDIVAADPKQTIVHPPQVLNSLHSFMDSHPVVDAKCLQVAEAA